MHDQEPAIDYADGALRITCSGSIATIRIDRRNRKNAISRAMWQALPDIVSAIDGDERIRVVIVRGTRDAFSAGADIGEFAEVYANAESTSHYNATVRAGQAALRALPRPTIALIEGVCIGGGCGLALACDLRFASTEARFAITPARLGLAYSFATQPSLSKRSALLAPRTSFFPAACLKQGKPFRSASLTVFAPPPALRLRSWLMLTIWRPFPARRSA